MGPAGKSWKGLWRSIYEWARLDAEKTCWKAAMDTEQFEGQMEGDPGGSAWVDRGRDLEALRWALGLRGGVTGDKWG